MWTQESAPEKNGCDEGGEGVVMIWGGFWEVPESR